MLVEYMRARVQRHVCLRDKSEYGDYDDMSPSLTSRPVDRGGCITWPVPVNDISYGTFDLAGWCSIRSNGAAEFLRHGLKCAEYTFAWK